MSAGAVRDRRSGKESGFLRQNGLLLALAVVFVACMVAQVWSGERQFNEERQQHGKPALSLGEYLTTGHFWEATAENWESEFLQMAAYVLFTAGLYQKGSAESKKLDKSEAVDRDPRQAQGKRLAAAPWPVRRGGWVLVLYENSLSLAFVLMFLLSFFIHAMGGAKAHKAEEILHGGQAGSVMDYLASSQFWFESFQNWQSEFLSLVAMVGLSIFLRQRGSPESKPVDAPNSHTGAE